MAVRQFFVIGQEHRGEVPLAVAIEDRHTVAHLRESAGKMYGRGGFPHTALVVDDGDSIQGAFSGERAVWAESSVLLPRASRLATTRSQLWKGPPLRQRNWWCMHSSFTANNHMYFNTLNNNGLHQECVSNYSGFSILL
jgi:hypothetical protein